MFFISYLHTSKKNIHYGKLNHDVADNAQYNKPHMFNKQEGESNVKTSLNSLLKYIYKPLSFCILSQYYWPILDLLTGE